MKTIPVSSLVAGMLLPAVCLAQSEGPPKGPPGDEKGVRMGLVSELVEAWKNADTDHDGSISKAEFDAAPRLAKLPEDKRAGLFSHLDRNNDGKIDRHEAEGDVMEAWKKADADHDGLITPDEFKTLPRLAKLPDDKRANLFARLDKNSDGKIDRAELEPMTRPHQDRPMKKLWELDADKSGGVDFEEFKAGPVFEKLTPEKLQEIFNRLDTDGDKVITPKDKPEPPFDHRDGKPHPGGPDGERRGEGGRHGDGDRSGLPHFNAKMDTNQDGSVSFEEFRANERVANLTEDEQEDRFEALDKNHDLKLTPDEFGPPPPPPAPPAPPAEKPAQ